ncbi:MAG: SurA N-terminal domain-containing protein, partial [Desulfobacteraceae bacterium]
MVLSLMRKHAKSWLIKFMIGMIAVVFIFYFGYSFRAGKGTKVAYVNGEVISGVEYQKAYRNLLEGLQRQYKSVWSDNLIEVFDIKNRALENLINQKIIAQEARKIGLDVTEREIQQKIMAYPAFQFRGQFDESRYRALLQNNRMKPEDFEAAIAQELLREKVGQFLMTFLPVTEQQVLDRYTFYNEKVKVSFVQFLPENFKGSIKIDEADLERYFDEHKEAYRIPEKIKLAYIVIDPADSKEGIKIAEEELIAYYEDNIAMFSEKKRVKARHILFKLKEDASEEDVKKVKEKASPVLKKARAGEDFASLAKKHSEGPTAKQGGDLGYFSAGEMVKPFEEAAFKMKKGEISDLVRSRFGYHIIKIEDIKEARRKSLEESREQISKALTHMIAMDIAH